MLLITIISSAVCFFAGMLFGARMYYQMRVRKHVKERLDKIAEEFNEAKWKLSITKLGSLDRQSVLDNYHIKHAQLMELRWVMAYHDFVAGEIIVTGIEK